MAWWTWGKLTGALVRRVPATLVNVSRHGCLIETTVPLAPGVVGSLRIEGQDQQDAETIRICRLLDKRGGALPFCAGSEFLILDAPSSASLRHRAASLEQDFWSTVADGTEENSGMNRTSPKVASRQDSDTGGVNRSDSGNA
jgi:hypothetical protein